MRCNICNKSMTDKEIQWNEDLKTYEPCVTCLDIAMDAAYSQGYDYDEEEYTPVLDGEFDDEAVILVSHYLFPLEYERQL